MVSFLASFHLSLSPQRAIFFFEQGAVDFFTSCRKPHEFFHWSLLLRRTPESRVRSLSVAGPLLSERTWVKCFFPGRRPKKTSFFCRQGGAAPFFLTPCRVDPCAPRCSRRRIFPFFFPHKTKIAFFLSTSPVSFPCSHRRASPLCMSVSRQSRLLQLVFFPSPFNRSNNPSWARKAGCLSKRVLTDHPPQVRFLFQIDFLRAIPLQSGAEATPLPEQGRRPPFLLFLWPHPESSPPSREQREALSPTTATTIFARPVPPHFSILPPPSPAAKTGSSFFVVRERKGVFRQDWVRSQPLFPSVVPFFFRLRRWIPFSC